MAALISHVFNDTHADGADATLVNPSNWNDGHKFTGGTNGSIPLRDTSDATYGSSWLTSVGAGQVLVSAGAGSLPTWSAAPTLTTLTLTGGVTIGGGQSIATQAGGDFYFSPGGTARWGLHAASPYEFFPNSDNVSDLGLTNARIRTGYFGTALVVGTNPATTGAVRLPNGNGGNSGIIFRNVANSADVYGLWLDGSNNLAIGGGSTLSVAMWYVDTSGNFHDNGSHSMTIGAAFGCNGAAAQTAYASGGALAAYGAGANGFDTAGHASALYAMVVSLRAALVANGIMS